MSDSLLKFNKQQFEAWKFSPMGILFFGILEREKASLTKIALESDFQERRIKGQIDQINQMLAVDFESLDDLREFLLKEEEEKLNERSDKSTEPTPETDEIPSADKADRPDVRNEDNSGQRY